MAQPKGTDAATPPDRRGRTPVTRWYWSLPEQQRVAATAIVIAVLMLTALGISVRRIDRLQTDADALEQRIESAQKSLDQVGDAQDALDEVADAQLETIGNFTTVIWTADRVERVLKVEDLRQSLSRTESAWRDFEDRSLELPGERERRATYVELTARQDELSGPIALGFIEGDLDTMAQSPAFEEIRTVQTELVGIVAALRATYEEAHVDARATLDGEHREARDALDRELATARREVLLLFGISAVAGLAFFAVTWGTAKRHAEATARFEAERATQARRDALETKLHRALDMTRDEQRVFEVVREAIGLAAPGRAVEVLVADTSDSRLHLALSAGPDATPSDDGTAPQHCAVPTPLDCPAALGGETRRFTSSEDLDACPFLRGRPSGACAAICVPVAFAGAAIGVLHSPGPDGMLPDDETVGALELVASQAGDRVGMMRAFAESESQARLDPLTGLLNRRSLEHAVRRLIDAGTPYVVAYADLDRFKDLNDGHGHQMGDRALQLFAGVLRDRFRPLDLVCRWGGEEFLVVLPECSLEEATDAAERVRRSLADKLRGGPIPAFTVSFGLATSAQATDFATVAALADQALLAAKAAGRDRVLTSPAR